MKYFENYKSNKSLKLIICCISLCIITIICGIFVIGKYINVNKKEADRHDMKSIYTSTLIRHKGNSYIVVPEDMLEENETYISMIQQYNLPIKIDMACIDKVAEKLEGGSYLYTIKSVGDDILILTDYNNDYCYAMKK